VRALFDLNLLIAMLDEEHVHHARAQQWWAGNREHGWASCPLTENGFVRVLSQPRYSRPILAAEALELLAAQVADTDHAFWADDISLIDRLRFDPAHILGPKQLTDIYLLALAMKNGGRLATLDRAIPLAAVRDAKPRHIVVL